MENLIEVNLLKQIQLEKQYLTEILIWLTNNYTSVGAVTQAKNANINVANDINIKSQEVSGEQKFGKGDSQYNYYGFERNIGSEVKAENLNTIANNLNISGSAVIAKEANLNVDKLNIESKVDK